MALEIYEVFKEVILQHKSTQKQVRYQVQTYELGFYVRIEHKTKDCKDWYLEDVTSRNHPDKIRVLIKKEIEKYRAADYRIVKEETMKVKRDPKVYKYIV